MKTKTLITATSLLLVAIFTLSTTVSAQYLYGMTNRGGTNDFGVLFQFNLPASLYTKTFDFTGANGANPAGSLILASDGNFYGLTTKGGTNNNGVLFQYNPSTSAYTKKIDFTGINGAGPEGSLVQASDGNLYGMTSFGGSSNLGVLFQFDPATNIYTKKYDFGAPGTSGLIYGYDPAGDLIQASDGNLYGMTNRGGTNDFGVLFQFDPAASIYTKKVDFTATNGQYPSGSLMQASDGNLYGMTPNGGTNGAGVLFQFNPATSTCTKEVDFIGPNGSIPYSSLMQASNGNIYGVTSEGGSGGGVIGYGILFQFNPSTSTFTKKFDFTGTNGANPSGSLFQASDGNLYGMAARGGTNDEGVLFKFNPVLSVYTKKLDFAGANGAGPFRSLIETHSSAALVPAFSQWAFITLSVLVLGAGVFFVRGRMA